ncbi:MAG: DNA alkylation repair protein [Candidatus Pacearchaeota archaeon]|nr:DNA alkylation repair protein [Candidatus Pacearchaeota archaeon]
MTEEINIIRGEFIQLADKKRAENSKRYLKSPYEFYGLKIPEIRKIVKNYKNMDFYSALNLFDELWNSGNHEEMCFALFLLEFYVKKYPYEIWKFLSVRVDKAKTWDHVDELSAHILGPILEMDIRLMPGIKKLSESKNPWFRRISLISTYQLIRKNKIELTLRLAEKLVYDNDIYVQKGAGWMLREAGKKNRITIREFILRHIDMKPNAFSYATEKMIELRKIKKEMVKKEREEMKEGIKKEKEEKAKKKIL